MENKEKRKPLLTVKQTAEHLNLSKDTIYRLISRREIPFIKIAGTYRFSVETLHPWIESIMNRPESSKAPESAEAKDRQTAIKATPPSRYATRSTAPAKKHSYPAPVREGYTPIYPVPFDL